MLQDLSVTSKPTNIEPITPDFELAAYYEQDDHNGTNSSDSPTYWKLKKTRNGFKGRTFKHHLNDKKKKIENSSVFKPLIC